MPSGYKHGLRWVPEYQTWCDMKSRCYNDNCKNYKYYGGRGIKVCARWKDSFSNFYDDMGSKNGLTLDRIDVNGDYDPNNCRWTSWEIQGKNRRNKS